MIKIVTDLLRDSNTPIVRRPATIEEDEYIHFASEDCGFIIYMESGNLFIAPHFHDGDNIKSGCYDRYVLQDSQKEDIRFLATAAYMLRWQPDTNDT